MKSNAHSTFILFLLNHKKSEVFKMVFFAIVACPDPAQRPLTAEAKSRNSGQFLPKLNKNAEFRDFASAVSGRSVGSGHATKNFRLSVIQLKKNQRAMNSTSYFFWRLKMRVLHRYVQTIV